MIGALHGEALAGPPGGRSQTEIEHADGSITPLWADDWRRPARGRLAHRPAQRPDARRRVGNPGRLTVALAERGVPALGIDVAPHAVRIARLAPSLTLLRDVFSRVPGTGRWKTVLLADGSIGIGGDPAALLHRVAELLAPPGRALVEVQPPGRELRRERVRLRHCRGHGHQAGDWFPWAQVGADQSPGSPPRLAGARPRPGPPGGRWFATLGKTLES